MSWTLPRFDYLVTYSGASHVGMVRRNNEDAWAVEPTLGAFVIADGMGGHAHGELAAQIAVSQTLARLRTPDAQATLDAHAAQPSLYTRSAVAALMEQAVANADAAVKTSSGHDSSRRGMGCTLDLCVLVGANAFIAHVGDSRAYLARPSATIQLTNDHTVRSALMAQGVATPSEPPNAPAALVNAVGRSGEVKVDDIFVDLCPGDRIVLCTDGVYTELVEESRLASIAQQGTPEDAALGLVNAAISHAGKDNATAIVVEVGGRHVQRVPLNKEAAARDFTCALNSPLLAGLGNEYAAQALQSAIEVHFPIGARIPRIHAGDRVGYIVLEGSVQTPQGWTMGPGAVIYPEALAGGGRGPQLCVTRENVRAFRIRADDLREVCAADRNLGAAVYERLARSLARMIG
jgi:serine/threonine protein phosphatase PrpC